MPAGRTARQRAITNENDENSSTTRLTRAKAAALDKDSTATDVPKKALHSKKSTGSSANPDGNVQPRKRAALGDKSNVGRVTGADSKELKDAKKPMSKSSTSNALRPIQPSRIQKPVRTNSTRPAAGLKDRVGTTSDLKRPASGTGLAENVAKKSRSSANSAKSVKEEEDDELQNTALPRVSVEVQKTTVSVKAELEEDIKEHFTEEELQELEDEAPLPPGVTDLDAEDCGDPLMVSEYVHEIFDYLKHLEIATLANPNYMADQNELEWKMRGILVDWLLEVHTRFRLLPETLFLAVNIIDRFLSCKVVQLDRLQLVGVAAMFIASKYEEVISPHVQNFRHVTDDGFTEDEILSAERFVLAALNYDLSYPNPMNFLRRISKADNYDIHTRTLGKYLIEISCLDHRFIAYPGSQVAAAAMYLARLVLERGAWDATIAHYAGYTEEEIQPVLALMIDYLRSPVVHDAFFKKYASKKFLKASIVLRAWAKKYHYLYLDSNEVSAPVSRSG